MPKSPFSITLMIALLKRLNAKEQQSKIVVYNHLFVSFWVEPFQGIGSTLLETYAGAEGVGNV